MTIRWAEESDLEQLTEIFNYEVLNSTASFCITPQTAEERKAWFLSHDREARPLIVAEEDGRAVGYASLSDYRVYEAYKATVELSVYVDHRYRRRGIAEALMKHLLTLAEENETLHMVISVITGGNEPSIRLHEKLGFVYGGVTHQVGRKFDTWLDAVYYERMV